MQEKETQEQKAGQWNIALDATRIRTLDQLISRFEIDVKVWDVERFVCNKWEVASAPKATRDPKTGKWTRRTSKMKLQDLYQVKAWLRKKQNIEDALNELSALKEEALSYSPTFPPIIRAGRLTGNMVEIVINDAHIGKLAWNVESGHGDFDVNIATRNYREAMSSMLHRLSPYKLDQILLVIGNDLFHSDNEFGTTTRGTKVDTDGRYHKTYRIVRKMMAEQIEALRFVAPVKVVVMPGNHDRHASWHLGDSLECWFRNCPDVEVDNVPKSRKYHQHGKVLLGWCHGDEGKREDYPLQMATEVPQLWAATKYREMHTGHLHKTKVDEYHGVRVRIIPSLGGTDRWSSRNGYTGNVKAAEAFIWNAKAGLIGTAVYNVLD